MTTYSPTSAERALTGHDPTTTWPEQMAVLIGYLLLGVWYTWPLVTQLSTGVIQKGALPIDSGQGIWSLWWVQQATFQGWYPYMTRYIFFPETVNLFWQTISITNTLPAVPVTFLLGPIAAFNMLVLISFGLSGLAVYNLVLRILDQRFGALVAGFVYACSPYHVQVVLGGTLESIAIHWIPIYVLLLLRALRGPNGSNIALAGAGIIVTTLSSYYYGIYCAIYTALHIGLLICIAPSNRARARYGMIGASIGLCWLAIFLPVAWLAGSLSGVALEDWYDRQIYHSVALVDLLAPNPLHPIWGAAASGWLTQLHPFGVESGASVGAAAAILIIAGCIRVFNAMWPWLVLAIGMLVLALGPELHITGVTTGIRLPFALLDVLGPFRNSSRPAYFVALWMLPISLLIGNGVQSLSLPHAPLRWPVILLAVLLLIEFLPQSAPVLPIEVDRLYSSLRSESEPGAILELPPQNDASQQMLNQICHGRPLAGGYLARTPNYPLVTYNSALHQLWYASGPKSDILARNTAQELAAIGIHIVALNLDKLSSKRLAALRQQLTTEGIQLDRRDEHVELYRVDMRHAQAQLILMDGWQPPETAGSHSWRWMGERAVARLIVPVTTHAVLTFSATAFQAPRPLTILFDNHVIGQQIIPAAPAAQSVSVAIELPAGNHQLFLESAPAEAPDHRWLSVSVEQLRFMDLGSTPIRQRAIPLEPVLPPIHAAPCG
jgi:hypothetical protein